MITELAELRKKTNKIQLSLKDKTSALKLLQTELEKAKTQGAIPKTKFNFESQENDDTDANITQIINNIKAIKKEQQEILRKTKYCPEPECSTSEKLKTATLNLKEKMTKLLKNKQEKK